MFRWRRRSLLLLLWLALASLGTAAADTASRARTPTSEPFAQYENSLNAAADRVLSGLGDNPSQPQDAQPAASGRNNSDAERTQFHWFAEQYWKGRHKELQEAVDHLQDLRPFVEPIPRREGIPPELFAIVLVESAGRPLRDLRKLRAPAA